MNLLIAFWLLFAVSALLGGVALLLSLRLLLSTESRSSRKELIKESCREQMKEYGILSPESFVSKPNLVVMNSKTGTDEHH